ncbi:hypothetical protein KCU73_g4084, partial [Aureobasidium melanogenum]
MASLTIDSELMTNFISAVPVPAGGHHVAVLDEKRMPLLFTLSNDRPLPRLQILRRDHEGQSSIFDVGKQIGLPGNAYIQSFHVEQSWNLKLYLAVSYRDGDDDSKSLLHLTKPFLPERLKQNGEDISYIPGSTRFGNILEIRMAPISGDSTTTRYPDVFLIHRALDQSSSWGSDISHVHVQSNFSGWYTTQQLDTPQNVSEILDIAPATSPYGQGLYVLYVSQGQTKLYARYLRPDPNASDGTMYTFTTSDGNTCLMIASSEGIRYLTVADSTSKDRPGKLILTGDIYQSIRQLFVAQDKEDVTIWFRNAKDELGYARAKVSDIERTAISALLLPAGMSSAFAPLVSAEDGKTGLAVRQMVVSNDRQGNLCLLEQSGDLGLWRKTPFYEPSSVEPTPLKSYTVTMKAKDSKGTSLSYGSLRASASSSISAILNGRNILLTSIPTWFDCDQSGSLDFIIPSDGLGAQELKIEAVREQSGEVLEFTEVRYDPSQKPLEAMHAKLMEASSVEKFRALKTQSGQALFDANIKNDEKLMQATRSCLQTVTGAYNSMKLSPGSVPQKSSDTETLIKTMRAVECNFENALMDGFYWVKEKISEATDWIIKAAGDVWKFVCTIAGEVKEFVLDCVEKICEAATWVWEKVKVGWEKLVDFIGFIFNWDDILATKDTISATITAGFGYAAIKMDDLTAKADGFFTDLEKTVDEFGTKIKLDKKLNEKAGDKDENEDNKTSSTSTTWASERLKNGGAGTKTSADLKGEKKSGDATNFWNDVLVPEVAKLDTALSRVGQDITALFKKEGSIDGNDIVNVSKSLLKAGIATVRSIVKGLLQLVKAFIGKLCDLGNAEINIPVFSWLYKKISKGHALTLFDAISLIIAIPTTIIAKLITGKAPPTFEKMDAQLLKSLTEGGDIADSVKANWAIFRTEVVVGITLTSGAIGIIKLLYKMATQGLDDVLEELDDGPSSLFDIFGIVVDMISCLMAIPENEDMPGAGYRHAVSAISCVRGVYHTIAFFAKGGETADKVVLALDLLTVLANMGLSIAIGVAEHQVGDKWEDYEEDATNTGFITTGLNALAGIGYFTAFFFKTNPDISAGGAAVMIGTMAGAAALEGIVFKLQYDAQKKPGFTSPPPF